MADPGGLLGVDAPQVEGGFHELVSSDRVLVGQALLLPAARPTGPVEPALAGHHHPFGDIA